jgi:hypothetical protein
LIKDKLIDDMDIDEDDLEEVKLNLLVSPDGKTCSIEIEMDRKYGDDEDDSEEDADGEEKTPAQCRASRRY